MPKHHPTLLREALESSTMLLTDFILQRAFAENTYAALKRKIDQASDDDLPTIVLDHKVKNIKAAFSKRGLTPIPEPTEMTAFLGGFVSAFEEAGSIVYDFSKTIDKLNDIVKTHNLPWRDLPDAFFIHFGGALTTPIKGNKIEGVYFRNTKKALVFIAFPVQSLMTVDCNKQPVPDLSAINRHMMWSILHNDPKHTNPSHDFIGLPFEDQMTVIATTFSAIKYLAQDTDPDAIFS